MGAAEAIMGGEGSAASSIKVSGVGSPAVGRASRRCCGRILLVAALGLSALGSSEALAQATDVKAADAKAEDTKPADAKAAESSSEAVQFFEKGTKAAKAERWEEAREAFTEAWKRKRHWQIAAHLGRAELMSGRPRDAAEHLWYFLREAKDLSDEDRQKTQEMMGRALAKVGTLTVRVNVEGAEVFVDGRSVGRSPIEGPVFVEPGRRTIEARREGYATAKVTEEVKAGGTAGVELTLAKSNTAVRPVAEREIADETRPKGNASPTTSDSRNMLLIIGGASASVVLLVGGAIFWGLSEAKASERDDTQNQRIEEYQKELPGTRNQFIEDHTMELEGLERERLVLAVLSLGSFIGSGLVGGATAYVALNSRQKPHTHGVSNLYMGFHGLGVMVRGQW